MKRSDNDQSANNHKPRPYFFVLFFHHCLPPGTPSSPWVQAALGQAHAWNWKGWTVPEPWPPEFDGQLSHILYNNFYIWYVIYSMNIIIETSYGTNRSIYMCDIIRSYMFYSLGFQAFLGLFVTSYKILRYTVLESFPRHRFHLTWSLYCGIFEIIVRCTLSLCNSVAANSLGLRNNPMQSFIMGVNSSDFTSNSPKSRWGEDRMNSLIYVLYMQRSVGIS